MTKKEMDKYIEQQHKELENIADWVVLSLIYLEYCKIKEGE